MFLRGFVCGFAVLTLLGSCATGPDVRCGQGTELVAGACLITCAADQKRVGERCVARCEPGTTFMDGDCKSLEAALIATYEDFGAQMCACKDNLECGEAVEKKADTALSALANKFPDGDPRAAFETARPAYEKYQACKPESAVIGEFATLTKNMCACMDKACAESVNAAFDKWIETNANAKGSQEEQRRAKALAEQYTGCMMKVMAADVDNTGLTPKP